VVVIISQHRQEICGKLYFFGACMSVKLHIITLGASCLYVTAFAKEDTQHTADRMNISILSYT